MISTRTTALLLAIVVLILPVPMAMAQSGSDIVIIYDRSRTMLPYFEQMVHYAINEVLSKQASHGDTVHLLSFDTGLHIDTDINLNSESDIRKLLASLYSVKPLAAQSNPTAAITAAMAYIDALPLDSQKHIFILSGTIFNSIKETGSKGLALDSLQSDMIRLLDAMAARGWAVKVSGPTTIAPSAVIAPPSTAPVPTAPVPTAPVPTAPVPTAPVPTAPVPTAPPVSTTQPVTVGQSPLTTQLAPPASQRQATTTTQPGTAMQPTTQPGTAMQPTTQPGTAMQPTTQPGTAMQPTTQTSDATAIPPSAALPGSKESPLPTPAVPSPTSIPNADPASDDSEQSERKMTSSSGLQPEPSSLPERPAPEPRQILDEETLTVPSRQLTVITLGAMALALLILVIVILVSRRSMRSSVERPVSHAFIDSAARRTNHAHLPQTSKPQAIKPDSNDSRNMPASGQTSAWSGPTRQPGLHGLDSVKPTTDSVHPVTFEHLQTRLPKASSVLDQAKLSARGPSAVQNQQDHERPSARAVSSAELLTSQSSLAKTGSSSATILDAHANVVVANQAVRSTATTARTATDILNKHQLRTTETPVLATEPTAVSSTTTSATVTATATGIREYKPKVIKAGTIRLEMRVRNQNPNIGLRNIKVMHAGRHRSIGGGGSDFRIFLLPVPRRIADVHFDGQDITLVPIKTEFFPEYTGPIEACLGKSIYLVTRKGRELVLRFGRYIPPVERINRLLHCIDTPGIVEKETSDSETDPAIDSNLSASKLAH